MKIYMFAGGFGATLTARILPLAKSLREYNVDSCVITPIAWRYIATVSYTHLTLPTTERV